MAKIGTETIRAALIEFVGRHLSICFTAKVTDNLKAEDEGIVEVEFNDLKYEVKLQALSEGTDKGELKIPTKDSEVFCVSEGNSDSTFVVVATTELDKYQQLIGKAEFTITGNGFKLNRAESGLLKTLTDLCAAIEKLTVATAMGPSGVPINMADFTAIRKDLKNYLE